MRYFLALFSLIMFLWMPTANSIESSIEKKTFQLKDYLELESVQDPQISPDGKKIVYTRHRVDQQKDRMVSSLWFMNADGSKPHELSKGAQAMWSPDGKRIAFVKKDEKNRPQIFTRWMDSEGGTTQVTRGNLAPRSMEWSPDGKYIAFVARVSRAEDWIITLPPRPEGAEWTEDPDIIDEFHYRQDFVGSYNNTRDHLFIVTSEGGTFHQLTTGNWNVGVRDNGSIATAPALSWSPDGEYIVFDGNNAENWEMNYFVSQIYKINIRSKAIQQLTKGVGHWTKPRFSPDGKKIAYSGLAVWDAVSPFADVWVMDSSGENKKQLTSNLDESPTGISWAHKNDGLYFTMRSRGSVNLYNVSLNKKLKAVTKGMHVLYTSSFSKSGFSAAVKSGYTTAPDVIRFRTKDGAKEQRVTQVNADVLSNVNLGQAEELWYNSPDGTLVQGWILKPPGFNPSQQYPLYLSIHGGPFNMYDAGFSPERLEHAANGYVVLYTNPRGSTGYGKDFSNAIGYAYPGKVDYDDLMAGVDTVIAKGYIDTDRLYVEGCSGGGVLTTWVISHTDRFRAAVARCTVSNWISFAGTTDLVGWVTNFFEKPYWEDATQWVKHSPLTHVAKVKTPTLLMTGDKDLRTPLAQAEQYYNALKLRGIPTKLIPMRGEYHGTGTIPSNWLRTQLYIRKWFEEHTPKKNQTVRAAD